MGRLEGILVGLSVSMLCGQPVSAMVAGESETTDVIQKARSGIVVKPGDVAGIRSAILRLKEDASVCEAMGSNGRRYLEKNVAQYEEIFCALAGDGVLARRAVSSRSEDALGGLDSHGT